MSHRYSKGRNYSLARIFHTTRCRTLPYQLSVITITPISLNPCLGLTMFPAKWCAVVNVTALPSPSVFKGISLSGFIYLYQFPVVPKRLVACFVCYRSKHSLLVGWRQHCIVVIICEYPMAHKFPLLSNLLL